MAIITQNRFPADTPLYGKPLLVELPDDIVINGVAHDKLTLAPKFLRYLEYDTYVQNSMSLDKCWYGKTFNGYYSTTYSIDNGCNVVSTAILDNDDPNVVYHSTKYGYYAIGGTHPMVPPRLFKINNKTLEPTIEYKINGYTDSFWFIDQDSDYIYMLSRTGTQLNWFFNYMSYFDKSTLTIQSPKVSIKTSDGGLLKVTQNFIYMFGCYDPDLAGSLYGGHRMMVYNKANKSMAFVVEDTDQNSLTAKVGMSTYPSQVFSGAPNYYYYIRQTNNAYEVMRISFNDGDTTATPSLCVVDYGNSSITTILTKHTLNSYQMQVRAFRLQSGGLNYLCFSVMETRDFSATSGGFSNDTRSENIYVYEINQANPDQLVYRSTFVMGDDKYRYMIPLDDNYEMVMLVNEYGGKILRFSSVNKQYVEVEALAVPPRSVGVDSIGRTWITDDQNRLSLFTPQIPTFISAKTESDQYDYVGLDIPTNINLHALNYISEYISIPVKVTLTGSNMIFMDGTREKLFTTLDSGDLSIPIKIIGPGYTRVVASAEV